MQQHAAFNRVICNDDWAKVEIYLHVDSSSKERRINRKIQARYYCFLSEHLKGLAFKFVFTFAVGSAIASLSPNSVSP